MQESAVKQMGTAELIRHTVNNISALIDKQVILAVLEIKEDIVAVLKGAGVLILGLASMLLMAIALMIAAILALSVVMPGWLAALIVAAFFLVVGGVLTWVGRSRLRIHPLNRTRETLREDVEWARRRLTLNEK